MPIFEHISYNLPKQLITKTQTPRFKPSGLWLSHPGKWAEFSQHSYKWIASLHIDDDVFVTYAWDKPQTNNRKICRIDMSNPSELYAFINKYTAEGYEYEVSWPKVARDFGGVFFDNVVVPYPECYWKFNCTYDGSWIISIDVSSICLWNSKLMTDVRWKKKPKHIQV